MMAWLIFLGLIVLVGGAALGFLWLIAWQDVCPRAAIEATGNSHLVIASKERTGKLRVGDSMPAKLTREWIGNWICSAFHRRRWKPVWTAGGAQIEIRCERCGRLH